MGTNVTYLATVGLKPSHKCKMKMSLIEKIFVNSEIMEIIVSIIMHVLVCTDRNSSLEINQRKTQIEPVFLYHVSLLICINLLLHLQFYSKTSRCELRGVNLKELYCYKKVRITFEIIHQKFVTIQSRGFTQNISSERFWRNFVNFCSVRTCEFFKSK